MVTMPVEIYTDGSCLRNPGGASGWAFVIRYWDTPEGSELPVPNIIEKNQGYRSSTNNRMEIMAALSAIQYLYNLVDTDANFRDVRMVNIMSDSEYLCNAVNQRWIQKWQQNNWLTSGYQGREQKDVKNKDLWEILIRLLDIAHSRSINITFTHIKGHSGNEFNEKCDKLAVQASTNNATHSIDEVFEKTTNVKN